MVDKDKILAGRKAIDDYRAAHDELHSRGGTPEDHTPLLDTMLSELGRLGFRSADEFMKANDEAVLEDYKRCIVYEGECDFCIGRERSCAQVCYERRLAHIPPDTKNALSNMRYQRSYFSSLPAREKGLIYSMIPDCSINIHIVEEPAFDWQWAR